jgi:NADH-quinone oxidoreductase subunit N
MIALIILFITGVFALFAGIFAPNSKKITQAISLLGVSIGLITLFSKVDNPLDFEGMIVFDPFAKGISILLLWVIGLIFLLTGYVHRKDDTHHGDYIGLMLFSACGALCMVSYQHMVILFLGIEILSIPLYVLAGSNRSEEGSNEAALKYFMMGAFATCILLMGITLIYGATGTFDLQKLSESPAINGPNATILGKFGLLFFAIGMTFKIAGAPFHFWAPDVYEGSPNLVTAFMAAVVKIAGFAAIYKFFTLAIPGAIDFWGPFFMFVAILSLLIGNIGGLVQKNFKRIIAYSGIAHTGYLLLAILSPGGHSDIAILVYLTGYSVATVCALGVLALLNHRTDEKSEVSVFNNLSKSHPLLAFVMALSLISMAGIPPTAGFFGKYFLFIEAFKTNPILVLIAVIGSIVSIGYYFKVIIAMYFQKDDGYRPALSGESVVGAWVVMGLGTVVMMAVSFFPETIIGFIR